MGRLLGLLVLGIGVVWLLSNFGVLPALSIREILSMYWPVILIYFGVTSLWSNRKYGISGMIWPLSLIAVGVGFQLERLAILDFFSFVLPMMLILGGIALLFGRRRDNDGYSKIAYETEHVVREVKGSLLDSLNGAPTKPTFGSLRIGGAAWKLENASYSHKVGDVKVDLRETEIPLGETVLEISCNIGDVDVWLPEDADVWVQTHAKAGDVKVFDQRNSGTNASLTYKSVSYETAERKLKLLIWVKMGDIDVKRVE